ncbi:hypothetical protein LQW54_000345 [Pestalotiopsis sp. IQ-011]
MFWRRIGSRFFEEDSRSHSEVDSRSASRANLISAPTQSQLSVIPNNESSFFWANELDEYRSVGTYHRHSADNGSSILDLQSSAPSESATNGPSTALIGRCPRQHTLRYSTIWYRLDYVPDFFVCSRCYQDHIEQSQFSDVFLRFQSQKGVPHRCRFWVPRVSDSIWPEAKIKGVLDDMLAYAKLRATIPDDVVSLSGLSRSDIQWYHSPSNGFLACPACYQDQIVGSQLECDFTPYPNQEPTGEVWNCSLCHPAVHKALQFHAKNNDWRACRQLIRRRNHGSPCKGRQVDLDSGNWYSHLPAGHIWICEHCYLDRIRFTTFRPQFHLIPQSVRQLIISDSTVRCALSTGPLLMAFEASLARDDLEVFRIAATVVSNSKPCEYHGVEGRRWHGLKDGARDFLICRACFAGIMTSCDLDGYFQTVRRTAHSKQMCSLNPSAPRFLHYIAAMGEALDIGDFSIFVNLTHKLSGLPLCPGREVIPSSSAWLSCGGCVVCPECYETTISGTVFSRRFRLADEEEEQEPILKICSLASPRMRSRWWSACQSQNLDGFITYARARSRVYIETVQAIRDIKARKMSFMHASTSLGAIGVEVESRLQASNHCPEMQQLLAGDLDPSGSDVEVQRAADTMRQAMAEAIREDEWRLIDELEAKWAEVE